MKNGMVFFGAIREAQAVGFALAEIAEGVTPDTTWRWDAAERELVGPSRR